MLLKKIPSKILLRVPLAIARRATMAKNCHFKPFQAYFTMLAMPNGTLS